MSEGPLILGAGPAGCAAAIALANLGAAPLLLDRDAVPGDPLCGGFLSWRTTLRLLDLGIDPAALGAHPVTTLALFAGNRQAEVPLPGRGFGLSRHALDTAMRQRALAAGARFATGSAREIRDGEVIGRDRNWRGDGLFLATGKHDVRGASRPRRGADPALGLRVRLHAGEASGSALAGRIELHLFAGGYAGIVLQEDHSANICLALRKSLLGSTGGDPVSLLERLADENQAFAERLGENWRASRFDSIGSVPYGFLARDTASGLFRLGDQAAVIPSLAGEGIDIALASGTLAAAHWVAGGPAAAPAFQRAFAARAARPVRTAGLAWSLAENRRLASSGVALAARFPALVRWLMRATRV